jgi:hypothetical protein
MPFDPKQIQEIIAQQQGNTSPPPTAPPTTPPTAAEASRAAYQGRMNWARVQSFLPEYVREANPIEDVTLRPPPQPTAPINIATSPEKRPMQALMQHIPTLPGRQDPYPLVKQQELPEEYGLGAAIKDRLARKWQVSEEKVAEAGKGGYRPVTGLLDITYNIGQWNPAGTGIGKPLTALAQGALLVLGSPAEITEQSIGHAITQPIRDELQIGDDPVKEQAFQTALRVTYSGPEAVRSAYHDAYKLAQEGQLDSGNMEVVEARNAVWYKEVLGQIVLDPLNLLSAPGKAAAQGHRLRQADKLFMAAAKEGTELVSSAKVADEFTNLATKTGQAAEAENFLDKTLAYVVPRLKSAVVHKQQERISQVVDIAFGTTERGVLRKLADQGLRPGTPEFIARKTELMGNDIQRIMSLWAQTADENIEVVTRASTALGKMGFGSVPQSIMGRRTGYVMKQLIGDMDKEGGRLTKALMGAQNAEEAASMWTTAAAKVLDVAIKEPKFERGLLLGAARAHLQSKWRRAADDTFAKAFMGMSLGFPIRNFSDNVASMAVQGWSPFRGTGAKYFERIGFKVKGAERGIGAVGQKVEGSPLTTFGLKVGEAAEEWSSQVISYQAFTDATNRLWRRAVQNIQLPAGADDAFKTRFNSAVKMLLHEGEDELVRLETELTDYIRRSAATGAEVTATPPPAAANVFNDPWRFISSDLSTTLQKAQQAGDDVITEVNRILRKAPTSEAAIDQISDLQRAYGKHIATVADTAQPWGHAQGTLAGEAVQQATRADIPINDMEKLVAGLNKMEHGIEVSRAKAISRVTSDADPETWLHFFNEIEDEYRAIERGIRTDQTYKYSQLLAGQITMEEYTRDVFKLYADARGTLDRGYSRLINGVGRPATPGTPEGALRFGLLSEAMGAGYPSGVVKNGAPFDPAKLDFAAMDAGGNIVNDTHFMNKVAKLLGLDTKIKYIADLSEDQLLKAINGFRQAKQPPLPAFDDVEAALRVYRRPEKLAVNLSDLPKLEAVPTAMVSKGDISKWQAIYHLNDKGKQLFEPLDFALRTDWTPRLGTPTEPFSKITFKRVGGKIMGMRGSAHAPSEGIFLGNLAEDGTLSLVVRGTELDEIGRYADDLVKSGVSPDTVTGIPGDIQHLFGEQKVRTLGDLTTEGLGDLAHFTDPSGQKVYTSLATKAGQLEYDEAVGLYTKALEGTAKGGSAQHEAKIAAEAANRMLSGDVESLIKSSHLAATTEGSTEMAKVLAAVKQEIEAYSKLPATPGLAVGDDVAKTLIEWQGVFGQLRSALFETRIRASEAARRARDMALLDYSDRRTLDVFLKVAYPWHYWWSRKIPNWAASMALNPAMVAHYMNFKRELRSHNDQDTTIPDWAKDQLVIQPPGYPGQVFLNFDSSFNAIGTIFETWEDPDQERDALGKLIQKLGMVGPAPHPLLIAAYAAERGILHGDEDAARSYGYFAGATRGFAALTGKTLEPWLWLKDPTTGKRIPWTGGTKWDIAKASGMLGNRARTGEITSQEAIQSAATRSGETFEETMQRVMDYRRVPAIGSVIFGLRLTPRQTWENEIAVANMEYKAAKQAEDEEGAKAVIRNSPWLSAVWMSYDNEIGRMASLAKSVFARVPPGMGKENQAKMYAEAGITPNMREAFFADYDDEGGLAAWDELDYAQFARGIIQLGEILGMPGKQTAEEWAEARRLRDEMYEEFNKQFPDAQKNQPIYFQLKEAGLTTEADELAKTTGLYDYWDALDKRTRETPALLKHYGDPLDIDQAAESLMHEEAERRWPGIHQIQNAYYEIDEEDWRARTEYRVTHPELKAYWNWRDQALADLRTNLRKTREQAGIGPVVPETVDYIIKGKPTMRQQGILGALAEIETEAALIPPEPPPEPSKYSPEEIAKFTARDKVYEKVLRDFPNGFELEKEYDRIKRVNGEEAAKIFAKSSGLYDWWARISIAQAHDPLILVDMEDDRLVKAADNMAYAEAERLWPGIFELQAGYYAIPANDRPARREYLIDLHPELQRYWEWKEGAKAYYYAQLMGRRTALREQEAE